MISRALKAVFGSRNDRLLKHYGKSVRAINALEPSIAALTDHALASKTVELRESLARRIAAIPEAERYALDYPSAGSVFKNPKEGPAGKWIEEAGLKGFRLGRAMVSERHANFIINLGKATAEEVIRLMEFVEKKVYEEKGISLEREVKVVGER